MSSTSSFITVSLLTLLRVIDTLNHSDPRLLELLQDLKLLPSRPFLSLYHRSTPHLLLVLTTGLAIKRLTALDQEARSGSTGIRDLEAVSLEEVSLLEEEEWAEAQIGVHDNNLSLYNSAN